MTFLTNTALSQSVLHSLVTGKTAIFEICPEKLVLDYEQNAFFWDLPVNADSQQQKTRRGKCLLREKGYVIGEITALEVAVITYIKRGEGWYLISLCLYDTSDNLRNVSDLFYFLLRWTLLVQLSFSLENSWKKPTKNIKASCRLKNQREFLQFKKVQPNFWRRDL